MQLWVCGFAEGGEPERELLQPYSTLRGENEAYNNTGKRNGFLLLYPRPSSFPILGLAGPDIFHPCDTNSFNLEDSPFCQTCAFTEKFLCVRQRKKKTFRWCLNGIKKKHIHAVTWLQHAHIKPLERCKCMYTHSCRGSCPNKQPASSATWQTGYWVRFHQSKALIRLPSVLFIFCFASSLSRAFEIFPPRWSLSFHLHWWMERVRRGRGEKSTCFCTSSSTYLIHLPSIHLLILPTFILPSPCQNASWFIPHHFSIFFPFSFCSIHKFSGGRGVLQGFGFFCGWAV